MAYLEKLRSDKLQACGIMIQKHVKGWIYKKKYLAVRKTALLLQIYARGRRRVSGACRCVGIVIECTLVTHKIQMGAREQVSGACRSGGIVIECTL